MRCLTRSDDTSAKPLGATLFSALMLLLPPGLLVLGGLTGDAKARPWLWGGAGATFVLGLLIFVLTEHKPLRNTILVMPCAIALIWTWYVQPEMGPSPFPHFAQAVLLLVGSGLFALQSLVHTGAPALRHARKLAQALMRRTSWPPNLEACRTLPEVRELREALTDEAAPVIPLLADARPQVQIAALGALEFRKHWRAGQPDLVLNLAQKAPQPEIRAAAILALGSVHQRLYVEAMAEQLRDPDPLVRKAAGEALLWDCKRRWLWLRAAIHDAFADPNLARDGPLAVPNGTFPPAAVSDLTAWAAESGTLGVRATQTLSLHYSQLLASGQDPNLMAQLCDQVANVRASAVLRVELAHLLRQHNQLRPDLLVRLMDSTNPSPLRLMAVEAILQQGRDERAIDVLREVARQPNRELSLSAAIIVQKYLHVDLGLALGEPPPALHTRQAAEVTRRVIDWAKQIPSNAGAVVTQGSGW